MSITKSNEVSPKMQDCIDHMKRHNNKLLRFPGGYWAREGWSSWNGPCYGTPTVEALVRRGLAEYTVWKTGKHNKFPIEVTLSLPGIPDNSQAALDADSAGHKENE